MLFLLLIFVLSSMALTVVIWVGAAYLQSYYYTEPSQGIAWQAPAAGFTLGLFLTVWCLLIVNSTVTNIQDLPYDTIFSFKPRVDKFKVPVKDLWVVKKGSKEPVHYKLSKKWRGGTWQNEYVEAASGRAYSPSGVEEIILKEDGNSIRFLPLPRGEGSAYRDFADDNGWTIREFPQTGPTGMPEAFRWSRFLANIFLNLFHLALWFVCLWLLVRFQWTHALVLAVIMWLIVTLAILPMLLERAGIIARDRQSPAPAALHIPKWLERGV